MEQDNNHHFTDEQFELAFADLAAITKEVENNG